VARPEARPLETLIAIRREAWRYECQKPGRVPAADSPNRPELARLWLAAWRAVLRRRNLRTFRHAGIKFGVVYIGAKLCVFEWHTRSVLVRTPTSFEALAAVIGRAAP
jgi:hypothetical protein